ncbi:MAG: selenide, water dikinase SelD [Spirochaetales bacterium]|nr:selenide, water dikinase SelD [Spirochaetales bacterium]
MKLTEHTKFSGCGAKLGPGLLDKALCELSQPAFPQLLVDYRHSDDAGVWRINDETALVQTVDFFPPIVDDPFAFGRIASANALSDVYAMGGTPITALSIVAFPTDAMDLAILRQIMAGALDALGEANAALVGGHSIKDEELKFGLAVSGLVHPERALRNNCPQSGDVLILTKALGTGCINRAHKAGRAPAGAMSAAEQSMAALNKSAAEVLTTFPVHACTDVTGFGLLGHGCEMISGSGCTMEITQDSIITLPGALECVAAGLVPGGTGANRSHREKWIANASECSEETLNLLFDPQTSGGLLAALPAAEAPKALDALSKAGCTAFPCGRIVEGEEQIHVMS